MNINVKEFITEDQILLLDDKSFKSKDEAFCEFASVFYKTSAINDENEFVKALYEREETGSTYMGDGIVVPHGKSSCVTKPACIFCRCKPFVWDESENEEANLFLCLAIPESAEQREYLSLLAKVSTILLEPEFIEVATKDFDKTMILNQFYKYLDN